jgi:hypothetical protein
VHELLALVPLALAPVQFTPGHGWHAGHNRVHACPGVARSRCEQVTSWAATARWRDCAVCIPPRRTLARLAPGGVAIQLTLARERRPYFAHALAWPPRIRRSDVKGPIEGGPERIGSVQKFGRLDGFDAYLYLFFGRRHPSAAQLARANAELRSAKLP